MRDKVCLKLCRFRGSFNRHSKEYGQKKAAAKNYSTPRSNLGFKLTSKSSKHSMGPSPVLSEGEEQVLQSNAWMTDSEEDLLGGRWVSVKEFLTLNQRKTLFKDDMPRNRWLQAVLHNHHQLSTLTSDSLTSSTSTMGEADIRKWQTRYLLLWIFR